MGKTTRRSKTRDEGILNRIEDIAKLGSWTLDVSTQEVSWSEQMYEVHGVEMGAGDDLLKLGTARIHPDDRDHAVAVSQRAIENGVAYQVEYRVQHPRLGERHVLTKGEPVTNSDGMVTHYVGIVQDITEQKRIEQGLRESETRLSRVLDATNEGVWDWNIATDEIHFSANWFRSLGYEDEEGTRDASFRDEIVHPDDLAGTLKARQDHIDGRSSYFRCENRLRKKDGSYRWNLVRGKVVERAEDGTPLRMVGTDSDVTEWISAQQAIRDSEARIQSIFRAAPVGIGLVVDRVFKDVNDKLCEMVGYTRDELLDKSSRMIYPTEEDYRRVGTEKYDQIREKGYGTVETRFQAKDGTIIDVLLSSAPIDPEDYGLGVTFTVLDITERKRASISLQQERDRLSRIYNASTDYMALVARDGRDAFRVVSVNDAYWEWISGIQPDFKREEFDDMPVEELVRRCKWPMEAVNNWYGSYRGAIDTGQPQRVVQTIATETGAMTLQVMLAPIYDSEGTTTHILVAIHDVTHEKELEEQLRQSQKMEAVGQLAGGVAHDFNNILSVILGYAEMAKEKAGGDEALNADLDEIKKAAQRSAELTLQLLAFARKQPMMPRILPITDTVGGMMNMLRRLIGERIELRWAPAEDLWSVKMDPGQIDQILANLVVNSRDAIDGVGEIKIAASNVTFDRGYCLDHAGYMPGEFVYLSVADNGSGMSEAVRRRIFEPFYSTKQRGKGTGLGLATVYGIVQQNGGFLRVQSAPGAGTTVQVYLPRHVGETAPGRRTEADTPVERGTETVLLVEDEVDIRRIAALMLEDLGYRVLATGVPSESIEMAEAHQGDIQLLITDVIMPEMNGLELAQQLRRLYPELKHLFMSGYTADVIAREGILNDDVHFIQKPFLKETLAAKVREVLG